MRCAREASAHMVAEYRFHGHERVTLELDGLCDAGQLRIPPELTLELDAEGRARVRLFAFDVEALRITGVPLVQSSYAELLWRVAVRAKHEPAWWVIACDLGAAVPRVVAKRLVRYPTRAQHVELTRKRLRSSGASGTLALALGAPTGETAPPETRVLLTGERGEWHVPWGDDGDASAVAVSIEDDSLAAATVGGAVAWSSTGWLRTGREHRCGVARR